MERRGRGGKGGRFELVLWAFLVLPVLVSSQLACYSDKSCSDGIGTQSEEQCCQILKQGSVNTGEDDEGCSPCRVYGWKGELEVEVEALGNVILTIGFSNGLPNRGRQFNLQYDVNTFSVKPTSVTLSINDEFVNVTVIRDDLMPLQRFNITLMEVAQNRQRGEILLHTLQIVIPGQKVPPSAVSLQISLTESQYTVMESASSLAVCVVAVNSLSPSTLSNLTQSATVNVSDMPGSASRFSDYSLQTNFITFTDVPSMKCASVVIKQDDLYENTETFTLSLTATSDVAVNQSTITVSILDSDTVTILLLPPQPSSEVNEATEHVVVHYIAMGGISPDTVVQFSVRTMDGTAKDVTDYKMVNSSLTVTGEMNGTVVVTIVNDIVFETSEVFSLVATTTQERVIIENGTIDIVIYDDDAVVDVQGPPVSIVEGATGDLCLSIRTDERASITVDISVNDTTTEGIDYTLSQKSLTLNKQSSLQCIAINASTDNIMEASETFTISLSSTDPSVRFQPGNIFPVTIEDATPPQVQVGFINTMYTVSEGDGSVEVCAVVYQTMLVFSTPLKVTLQAVPMTAKANDFTVNSTDPTISSTTRKACIIVSIIMDVDAENTETFEVTLTSTDPSVALQQTRVIVFIEDDDDDPIIDLPPVNDTISGDPVMTVPINAPSSVLGVAGIPSLCYEVHGESDAYFNMVSDQCLSVNAHYVAPNRSIPINVIDEVAVVAGKSSINVVEISINVVGCVATVGGVVVPARYLSPRVHVRRTASRVRIAVSSCDNELKSVVMWVMCSRQNITFGSISMETDTIRLVVARGYSLSDTSHGLVGQFWNIPISLSPLNETNMFLVTVSHPSSPQRKFVGDLYPFSWETLKIPCLYVGDRQAARSGHHRAADDSIIEGVFTDYKVDGRFATEFTYSKFGDLS